MKFNKDVMEKSAKNGFTNATDAADYLVNHGAVSYTHLENLGSKETGTFLAHSG